MAPPMRISPIFCFCFCSVLLIALSEAHIPIPLALRSAADIHDLLPKYGLPPGLLPNNVESYTLSDDGFFKVELKKPCYVQFDDLVYYDKEITGKLSYGSVSDVSGIQAKKLFVWLPVTGIKANQNSGTIVFYVGPLSEEFSAKQFEVVPSCKRKACKEARPEAM